MTIRGLLAAALAGTVAAAGVAVPAWADGQDPPAVPATPHAWIVGAGTFVYEEPGTYGHRIQFSVAGWTDRRGTAHGVLHFRHALPDGQVVAEGNADVTCLNVAGGTALVTAVVPPGGSPVVNHGFYLKIVDGAPDRIETLQAGGDPTRPALRFCVDTAPFGLVRYPVEHGGYAFGS